MPRALTPTSSSTRNVVSGLRAAEDGAQSLVHAGQPTVDGDRVGKGLLPFNVDILGDEVVLAAREQT